MSIGASSLMYTNYGILELSKLSTYNNVLLCATKKQKTLNNVTVAKKESALRISTARGSFISVSKNQELVVLSKNGIIDCVPAHKVTTDDYCIIGKDYKTFGTQSLPNSVCKSAGLLLSGVDCDVDYAKIGYDKKWNKVTERVPLIIRSGNSATQLAFLQAFFGDADLDLLCHWITVSGTSCRLLYDIKIMLANCNIVAKLFYTHVTATDCLLCTLCISGINNMKQFFWRFHFDDEEKQNAFAKYCEAEEYYDNDTIPNINKQCKAFCVTNRFVSEYTNDYYSVNCNKLYLEHDEPQYSTLKFVEDNLYRVNYDRVVEVSSVECKMLQCSVKNSNKIIVANGIVISA